MFSVAEGHLWGLKAPQLRKRDSARRPQEESRRSARTSSTLYLHLCFFSKSLNVGLIRKNVAKEIYKYPTKSIGMLISKVVSVKVLNFANNLNKNRYICS